MTLPNGSQCPFVAGNRIENPHLFVGRSAELREITTLMMADQPTSINLVGNYRIGKSSLLYHFSQDYKRWVRAYQGNPSRFVVVYLSLQDVRCHQEAGFYQTVAEELLKQPIVQHNPVLQRPLQGPLDRHSFATAMKAWKAAGMLAVLCLDRFDELVNNTNGFDEFFYDSLQELTNDSALMLIMATRQELELYRDRISATFNTGQVLRLKELESEEAEELVGLPRRNGNGHPCLGPQEQQLALQWGKQHPYLLQLAGRYLWQAMTQPGWNIKKAQQRFDQEEARYQSVLQGKPVAVPSNWHWWTPLRWIFWEIPVAIGNLAKAIGIHFDTISAWVVGVVVLSAIGLTIAGKGNPIELVKTILGNLGIEQGE